MSDNPWVYLVGLVITSGLAKYVLDLLHERKTKLENRPTPVAARQSEIDASLVTMARINDELEADNARLRETVRDFQVQMNDLLTQATRERGEHAAEREHFQREITALETKVRTMRAEHDAQMNALMDQVRILREHHRDTGDIPKIRS